jgi:hypothetical protein
MDTSKQAARRASLHQTDNGECSNSLLPAPLRRSIANCRWYFELTVSPGFDAEIPSDMPQKECQDEGVLVRNFAGDPELVFLGVFDGHGTNGLKASKFSSQHLPDVRARHCRLFARLWSLTPGSPWNLPICCFGTA